jgi:5-formyltetrahydrofolate cyclo-ligase
MKTKQELRTEYRQLRKALDHEHIEQNSRSIRDRFTEWLDLHPDLMHFHLFFPINRFNEVNTFYIKEVLESREKVLYTSQTNRENTALETLKLPRDVEFFFDEWGIPVPQESIMVSPSKLQVILVPLLAYDHRGNRVGFGKGYYDGFLSPLGDQVVKIGLSFFEPEEDFASDPHDVGFGHVYHSRKNLYIFG